MTINSINSFKSNSALFANNNYSVNNKPKSNDKASMGDNQQQPMDPNAILQYIEEQTGADEATVKAKLQEKFGDPKEGGTAPSASDIQSLIDEIKSGSNNNSEQTSTATTGSKLNTVC